MMNKHPRKQALYYSYIAVFMIIQIDTTSTYSLYNSIRLLLAKLTKTVLILSTDNRLALRLVGLHGGR